ncbi:MAG: F420-dependent NADP oxidoreductase [Paludibacteraceae bacterium]|nr:F420-dependent NADP oxidoreductase [Paludibacteraceae bacterium]
MTKSITTSSEIVFIGAGNVATNLALALRDAGLNIRQVYSRTTESASRLANQINTEAITDLSQVVRDADFYIYCLKDDVLRQVPQWKMPFSQGIHIHTSGTCGIEVFREAGCREYGVFYPFMTFTREKRADCSRIPLFIEGSDDVTEGQMEILARFLTVHIYKLDSQARAKLHLAGVFANNFTNVMLTIADDIAHSAGVDISLLMPLVQETLDKAATGNPFRNQTGPAVRGDKGTINAHRRLLAGHAKELEIYNILTDYIENRK